MNATNRPVDVLLSIDTSKQSQPLSRTTARDDGVSALKNKENSFDEVYRQQRRDDSVERQQERRQERVSEQGKRPERSVEPRHEARPVAEKEQKTAENNATNGKALPHEQASVESDHAEQPVVEEAGFELTFVQEGDGDLNTEITVQFDSAIVEDGSDEASEQLELGLAGVVDEASDAGTDAQKEAVETVINQQAQATQTAKGDADSKAGGAQSSTSGSDILKELKQSRQGAVVEGAVKAEVNNGAQAKPVAGGAGVQEGQIQLQDRFAQMPLGQDLKILREQVKAGSVTVGIDKLASADAAKSTSGTESQARINTLTQATQALTQTRPGTVTTTVQAPVGSADWGQSVSQRIMWLVNRGISSAELQLNPRELGPVDVRINMSGEQATVQFTSQQAGVREALESSVVRLREMLENSGLNLADVNVSDQSQSEQAQADARDTGSGSAGQSEDGDESDENIDSAVVQRIETDSLIDLHA